MPKPTTGAPREPALCTAVLWDSGNISLWERAGDTTGSPGCDGSMSEQQVEVMVCPGQRAAASVGNDAAETQSDAKKEADRASERATELQPRGDHVRRSSRPTEEKDANWMRRASCVIRSVQTVIINYEINRQVFC